MVSILDLTGRYIGTVWARRPVDGVGALSERFRAELALYKQGQVCLVAEFGWEAWIRFRPIPHLFEAT